MNITNTDKEIIIEVLGYLGTALVCSIFIPQIIHMVKNKSGEDLSYVFLSLNLISALVWLVYAALIMQYPLLASDIVILISTIIMFILKYSYSKK